MTPIDEQLVRATAAEHSVPGPVAQEFIARSRPCVHLVPYDEVPLSRRENARPAARTGGLPALPDGTDRPRHGGPLVLSVDCAMLPREVLDIELPADGHLLFFTEIEYEPDSSVVLHVPAGVPTTEHSATYELDGDTVRATVYEPRSLYPLTGQTCRSDWREAPATRAFLAGDAGVAGQEGAGGTTAEDVLDNFERAVLDALCGGTRPGVGVQLGGFSDPWDMAPDEGDLVLLAQMAGQAIDHDVFTMNLIVGTRTDIAARKYAALRFEQQC
ncbi:DUF1963 domain-containing protein [Streptomyces fructofermentans]|uniref:DUF1963 domain-containing protein n=1 Tax=Streptomyces fructofermentans TaxID=152141 RepID=UPI003789D880